jgi:hypothetical protein
MWNFILVLTLLLGSSAAFANEIDVTSNGGGVSRSEGQAISDAHRSCDSTAQTLCEGGDPKRTSDYTDTVQKNGNDFIVSSSASYRCHPG